MYYAGAVHPYPLFFSALKFYSIATLFVTNFTMVDGLHYLIVNFLLSANFTMHRHCANHTDKFLWTGVAGPFIASINTAGVCAEMIRRQIIFNKTFVRRCDNISAPRLRTASPRPAYLLFIITFETHARYRYTIE
ncbi:hypothetical protein EVAR_62680_1 [Eumeta japonica]|uniref:Uncharacterized protein n=1 Tax=Eumeta variegata TaxID=151549 RepID=A0A4C1Z3N8_EUMVA|nr:hypothetical protein EVAR_62680_1 [Eumeta japonica]